MQATSLVPHVTIAFDQARLACGEFPFPRLETLRHLDDALHGAIRKHRRIEVAESATEIGGTLSWGTPKADEPRSVTMPSALADKLAAHLSAVAGDGRVFTADGGGPLRSSTWRRRVCFPTLRGVTPQQA